MKPNEKASLLRSWRRGAIDLPRPSSRPVGDVLKKLLPKLGLDQQVRQNELVTDWPRIVGEVNARHCRPGVLQDGELTVVVDNSAWRMELESQKQVWIDTIRRRFTWAKVKKVKFRVEG